MLNETITHRTLLALGHTLAPHPDFGTMTVKANPERADKHGEISREDWTKVATALADSSISSRELRRANCREDFAACNEAIDIRRARARAANRAARAARPAPEHHVRVAGSLVVIDGKTLLRDTSKPLSTQADALTDARWPGEHMCSKWSNRQSEILQALIDACV